MTQSVWCGRKEACELLGIHKNRFYELVKAGVLKPVPFPTYVRKKVVARSEVLRVRQALAQA